jgi:Pyruvate/2-oxoacid:ferredoxin oxidoreductase delta subunit
VAKYNDAYQTIAEMWTFPESESFRKMLQALVTKEEAELLLECRTPVTVPELAARLNTDEKAIADKMDNFVKRGLVFKGKTQFHFRMGLHYRFAGHPAAGYEPPEEFYHWHKVWSQENPMREVKSWLERHRTSGHPLLRVYPSRLAIKANPKIKKEDLLWHEDIEQIFARSEIVFGSPCRCRHDGEYRETPTDDRGHCSQAENEPYNCFQFRKDTAEFGLARGAKLKIYSLEDAIAMSDESERAGLVHSGPTNSASLPGVLCNCCSDCCSSIVPGKASGRMRDIMSPSRFQPVFDQNTCTGCQTCLQRCAFDAIEMINVPGSKKMKARLIPENCMGCGVCVIGCKKTAITFELVRPPEHIPVAPAGPRMQPVVLK